jgi:DNA-3-methyladenine glycosylase II
MLRRATAHLRKVDPKLAGIMNRVGRCGFAPRTEGTHFELVARSILYQQLSGKAAATIHSRFRALFPDERPEPSYLHTMDEDVLRSVGLSRQKTAYLKDLARRVVEGHIAIESLHERSDEEVIEALTSIKGVGRWTAQMFLMFRLGRPDVLPDGDLGIQKGLQKVYRLRALPDPERVRKVGAAWAPYRSIASWYLWRALELPEEEKVKVPRKKSGAAKRSKRTTKRKTR